MICALDEEIVELGSCSRFELVAAKLDESFHGESEFSGGSELK